MNYRNIVDEIIAYDLSFTPYFYQLYEKKFGKQPTERIIVKAIEYYETGRIG